MRVVKLNTPPRFLSFSSVVGREEGEGPLSAFFDMKDKTSLFGQKTFELSESEMGRVALNLAMSKIGISQDEIDFLICGDLQNQCVASSLGVGSFGIPFLGIYGACSTCTEALLLTSLLLDGGSYKIGGAVTSSHNAAAERQFRQPLEYGSLRTPNSQWTATASGAFLLSADSEIISKYKCHNVEISDVMIGRIVDGATTDSGNMGGAMSFAAFESILEYFENTDKKPQDFDFVVTGDLGEVGSEILRHLLREHIPSLEPKHRDCGLMLYDKKILGENPGGASGCGCSASVLSAYFLPKLHTGEFKNILFLSTGALMSPSSVLQGKNIGGIAPAIHLRHVED